MRVLLVNPPSNFLMSNRVFPTLGLLYLSSYLKKNGYKDISLLDMENWNDIPLDMDYDLVGFYANTPQFPGVVQTCRKMRDYDKSKNILFVIGGPHVSGSPRDALKEFDHIIVGEGERALFDIVSGKGGLHQILSYPFIKDINTIPFPDRDIIDVKKYKYYINGQIATTAISSRGCPYQCSFCANNAWGKTLRMRTPSNVSDEIEILKNRYNYSAIMFFDDTMTVDKNRMLSLCNHLRPKNIIYRCFIRSDTINYDILRAMKESGCVEVGIGIESGCERILKTIKKGETIKQNSDAIKMCHDLGIRVKGFFIIGLPGEDRESVMATIDFLEKNRLDDLDITIYTPYPGSEIYRNKGKYDINFDLSYEDAWYKGIPGMYRSLVYTSSLTAEDIVQYRDEIEKRFKKGVA